MTRWTVLAYYKGKAEGERWAERDMADGLGIQHDSEKTLRESARAHLECRKPKSETFENLVAVSLGRARGYRQVVRTFEHGRWSI